MELLRSSSSSTSQVSLIFSEDSDQSDIFVNFYQTPFNENKQTRKNTLFGQKIPLDCRRSNHKPVDKEPNLLGKSMMFRSCSNEGYDSDTPLIIMASSPKKNVRGNNVCINIEYSKSKLTGKEFILVW
ncbi:hypothetical protein BB559_000224 [Furculomyces boomerangus]|uniref:Uncharacterized protein n=1 Tax=Furculomyces boomerangus TaxID=61424 RepID=A0A2T9Z5Y1_9FUNG|nr:hypothetical protein BB559_000224 [Furculomyces boomerangus]